MRLSYLLVALLLITSAQAQTTITTQEYWTAGRTASIEIIAESLYDEGRAKITDSLNNIIYEDDLVRKEENVWALDIFIPSNTQEQEYRIEIRLSKENYPDYYKKFSVLVREMTFIDRILMMLRTHLPFIPMF